MSTDETSESEARNPRGFVTTQWSIVLAAGDAQNQDSRIALARLCQTYWIPLYGFVRGQVSNIDDAQNLTQEFFTELLEKNYVGTAVPQRGRFRAFLLTALKHFLSKQWEKERAQKRGGGKSPISLDFAAADSSLNLQPASGMTAEQLYDQQWAITLLSRILERLESEFEQAGKLRQFECLKGCIVGDHTGTTYADVAATLGTTEAAAKQATSRIRRRYREMLRDEIAETVETTEAVDDEIRNLFVILSRK